MSALLTGLLMLGLALQVGLQGQIELAEQAYGDGRYGEAQRLFEDALEHAPIVWELSRLPRSGSSCGRWPPSCRSLWEQQSWVWAWESLANAQGVYLHP